MHEWSPSQPYQPWRVEPLEPCHAWWIPFVGYECRLGFLGGIPRNQRPFPSLGRRKRRRRWGPLPCVTKTCQKHVAWHSGANTSLVGNAQQRIRQLGWSYAHGQVRICIPAPQPISTARSTRYQRTRGGRTSWGGSSYHQVRPWASGAAVAVFGKSCTCIAFPQDNNGPLLV